MSMSDMADIEIDVDAHLCLDYHRMSKLEYVLLRVIILVMFPL